MYCIYENYPTIYCDLVKFRNWVNITIRQNKLLKTDDTVIGVQESSDHKTDDDVSADDDYDYDEQWWRVIPSIQPA